MDPWLLGGLVLGGAFVAAYVPFGLYRKHRVTVQTAVRLVFAAGLIVTPAKLAYLACTTHDGKLGPFKQEDRIYIVIGALVTLWVACADVYREMKPALSRPGVIESGRKVRKS